MIGRISLVRMCGALAAMTLLAGCKSSPSHYVSPRVIGRVLDAQTHQPIPGVQVQRVVPDYEAGTMDQVRGGETLARFQPLRTSADGTFNLDSQKSVALFSELAWFTVEISFDHRGYENFITNYTPRNAITSPKGEPVIRAGDIWLTPKSK